MSVSKEKELVPNENISNEPVIESRCEPADAGKVERPVTAVAPDLLVHEVANLFPRPTASEYERSGRTSASMARAFRPGRTRAS